MSSPYSRNWQKEHYQHIVLYIIHFNDTLGPNQAIIEFHQSWRGGHIRESNYRLNSYMKVVGTSTHTMNILFSVFTPWRCSEQKHEKTLISARLWWNAICFDRKMISEPINITKLGAILHIKRVDSRKQKGAMSILTPVSHEICSEARSWPINNNYH